MNQSITLSQITLITDGCSNRGVSPAFAAQEAKKNGITVNVIGITDSGTIGQKGEVEIESIANAGGGLYQIVPLEQIGKTVQMVTKQAMNKTIQQVVHTELTEILGKNDLIEIPPKERVKVVQMMDNMAEHSNLKVLLLIDQSTSMLKKMDKVEEAILDFQLSLLSRAGNSSMSIVTFPGKTDVIDIKIPWTRDMEEIKKVLSRMTPKGNTPTGPAILKSISYMLQRYNQKAGVLDEYII